MFATEQNEVNKHGENKIGKYLLPPYWNLVVDVKQLANNHKLTKKGLK